MVNYGGMAKQPVTIPVVSIASDIARWVAGHATVAPPNNGHSGDRPLFPCREVVPISEVTECML